MSSGRKEIKETK